MLCKFATRFSRVIVFHAPDLCSKQKFYEKSINIRDIVLGVADGGVRRRAAS